MEEYWKEITYAKKKLKVSNLGRIKYNGRILKVYPGRDGLEDMYWTPESVEYPRVKVGDAYVPVHCLVGKAYLTVPPGGGIVHKNGDRFDYRLDNLIALNLYEVSEYSPIIKGDHYKLTNLNVMQINAIRMWRRKGYTFKEIGDSFRVGEMTISSIIFDINREYVHHVSSNVVNYL